MKQAQIEKSYIQEGPFSALSRLALLACDRLSRSSLLLSLRKTTKIHAIWQLGWLKCSFVNSRNSSLNTSIWHKWACTCGTKIAYLLSLLLKAGNGAFKAVTSPSLQHEQMDSNQRLENKIQYLNIWNKMKLFTSKWELSSNAIKIKIVKNK